MQAIQTYREELKIKQVEINDDFISKSRYSRLESNIHKPTFEEVLYFSKKLGIRLPELLFLSNLSKASDYEYLGKKEKALKFLSVNNQKEFAHFFDIAFDERTKNTQYYSIYVLYLYVAKNLNYKDIPSDNKILRDMQRYYRDRKLFTAVDYEILGNLALFYPISDISFMINLLFPVEESGGEIKDTYVQITLKNLISVSIYQKDFPMVKQMLSEFDTIRQIPDMVINGHIDLEVIYLSHLADFVETKQINSYIKALEVVNLFKLMKKDEYYEAMIKEISAVAEEHNFKIEVPSMRYTEINQKYLVN